MSRFYAEIQGHRGPATRQGTEASGVSGHLRGWNIGGRVEVYDRDGCDVVELSASSGSNESFGTVTVAEVMRGEDGPEIKLMDRSEVRAAARRLLADEITPAACRLLDDARSLPQRVRW